MAPRNYSTCAAVLVVIVTMSVVYHLSVNKAADEVLPEKRTITDFIGRNQEDPELIAFIKTQIHPPSNLPYNIADPNREDYSQYNQTQCIKNVIGEKRNGFFVEVGAFDGLTYSNSFYWEKYRDWKGLLIEANPDYFKMLLDTRRKAYSIGACVSVTTTTELMRFHKQGLIGKLIPRDDTEQKPEDILVPCFPIYSLLAALDNPTVDLFSLDIEGWEIQALKTIPFAKVDIKLFLAEHTNLLRGYQQLTEAMKSFGYETKGKCGSDGIYVKREDQ